MFGIDGLFWKGGRCKVGEGIWAAVGLDCWGFCYSLGERELLKVSTLKSYNSNSNN